MDQIVDNLVAAKIIRQERIEVERDDYRFRYTVPESTRREIARARAAGKISFPADILREYTLELARMDPDKLNKMSSTIVSGKKPVPA